MTRVPSRRLLLVITSSCLVPVLASCGSDGNDVSAQDAQASYVAAVEEAVPLAARAVSATTVQAVGGWSSCMGGWQFRGTGAIHVAAKGDDAAIEQVRAALVDAGWSDHTQVEGHVSVDKGGLTLDVQRPNRAFRDLWAVAFYSECRIMTGSDGAYVEQSSDYTFPNLPG